MYYFRQHIHIAYLYQKNGFAFSYKKYPKPVLCVISTVPRQMNPIIEMATAPMAQSALCCVLSESQQMRTMKTPPLRFGATVYRLAFTVSIVILQGL